MSRQDRWIAYSDNGIRYVRKNRVIPLNQLSLWNVISRSLTVPQG